MLAINVRVSGDIKGPGNALDRDIDKLTQELAYRIVDESRRLIDESIPRGRVYRRGAIKGRRTKQGIEAGLRASGKTRMITGYRFHRASAPGQPLAEDTGRSYRDIRVSRVKSGTYRVRFGGWTGYWEFEVPPAMRRPTIIPAIERAAEKTFAESKIFN